VPDVLWEKQWHVSYKKKIHKMKRRQAEEGEEDD